MSALFHNTVIAHRGASAYAPENTIAAFVAAVDLGATWIEFDVRFTKCGMPVVFHDKYLQRIFGMRGKVSDFSFAYLRSLAMKHPMANNCGASSVPSLLEVLQVLANSNVSINIELKSGKHDNDLQVRNVISDIANSGFGNTILMSSTNLHMLTIVRKYAPHLPLSYVALRLQKNVLPILNQLDFVAYCLYRKNITAGVIQALNKKGLQVMAYTINKSKKAEKLFAMGVDAIFSDYPDLLTKDCTITEELLVTGG